MMAEDALRQQILDTLENKSGNSVCIDCGRENPEWASVNISVFLCIECAGIHRRLGTQVSRVKSVKLDRWTVEEVEEIKSIGNEIARRDWEALVPSIWPKPTPDSKQFCREQWIRAKYERREFMSDSPDISRPYMTGQRQGFLYKRKRSTDDWNTRYFVLDKNNLSYFINATDAKPKAVISLLSLNATFNVPGSGDSPHPHAMLITYLQQGKHRNLFVYSDTGHEIMDWFLAIRCAKLKVLKTVSPHLSEHELLKMLTWNFTKTGYLCKMPPSQKKFQKRYFVLDKTNVRYYNKPTDAYPLGEILLGPAKEGYEVTETLPDHLSDQPCMFMLKVPYRSKGGFPLLAESEQDKKDWMAALRTIINDPGTQDNITGSEVVNCYEDEKDYSLSFSEQ